MQIRLPRLFQFLSDARIGATFAAPRAAIVLDQFGELVLANRAALALLRVRSRTEAAAILVAERGPLAPILRELQQASSDAAQMHALPLRVGTARRLVEFSASRVALAGGGSVYLLIAREPAGAAPDAASEAAAILDGAEGAFALFDGDGHRLYANDQGNALLGAADSLAEIVPGAGSAIVRAREEGYAEAAFGVLRVLLQRLGTEGRLLLLAAFVAPAHNEIEVAVSVAPSVAAAPQMAEIDARGGIEVAGEVTEPVAAGTSAAANATDEVQIEDAQQERVDAEPDPEPLEPTAHREAELRLTPTEPGTTPSRESVGPGPQSHTQAAVASSRGSTPGSRGNEQSKWTQSEAGRSEPQSTADGAAAPVAASAATTPEPEQAAPEPQPMTLPRRFVWQTDADGRFTSVSPELAAVVGEAAAAIDGLDWNEAGTRIGIEGTAAVAEAVARRDTWSGVTVFWPVEGDSLLRPVDLAALPAFDRERRFLGYRGFGVFRDPVPRPTRFNKPAEDAEPPVLAAKPADKIAPAAPPRFTEPAPKVRGTFGRRAEKIVPLYKPEPPRPTLTPVERNAFREIAKVIGARMQRVNVPAGGKTRKPAAAEQPHPQTDSTSRGAVSGERAVLDRLPIGVVVHRAGQVLYANRTVLEWIGIGSVEDVAASGGLERLFAKGQAPALADAGGGQPIALRGSAVEIPVEARLISAPWEGETALVYLLTRPAAADREQREATELALREAEASTREMRGILDTATDGVALLDREGRVLGMNRSAEALFGFDSGEIEGRSFTVLFAPESHRAALDYLDGLASNGVASVLNDGREVIGRVREGGLIPLFMTLGRVGEGGEKFCAVFRDITQWKRAEEELVQARRQAERANSAKSEFLAKISHEIRTPLNAIIGFAEVMMEERLGPIANERYREYLKDIHTSGEHLISLINDLLDLSKIEAGKLDLVFSSVDLNEIASQSMALMQPQANRERIIIRTALSPSLPPVVADARSIRQIVLNLLSNSIRFTPPGGQVIVSTTLTDDGEVHLRVRDTGIGMTEAEIKTALEPFRQIATTGRAKQGGTGLGLPLTKALAEANRASFSIKSTKNAGTLVEIAFPSTRVLAE